MLIALPKGRLLPEIKDLFYKIGIEFDENSRKLIIETSKENIKIAILRTWDIPKLWRCRRWNCWEGYSI